MSAHRVRFLLVVSLLIPSVLWLGSSVQAQTANEAFDSVWSSTDQVVANGAASYSWFWGPEVRGQRFEPYEDSPGGQREVRYYDKSRMEINHPDGDPSNIYYVTNGLLTVELVTGELKRGDAGNAVEPRMPSYQHVAGDPVNNPGTPTYSAFAAYATTDGMTNRDADRTGQSATAFMSGDGLVSAGDSHGVTLSHYEGITGHNIASVFWDWFNSPASGFRPDVGVDWVYAAGLPISEPYWVDATVGGAVKPVLVQLFERRVLTYTESNNDPYRIEWGNIGQHYLSMQACGTDSGTGCVDESERVDLALPSFSNPTNITNPLFPGSIQHSVLLLGIVDDEVFRTEVTLLPEPRIIEWNGQQTATLVSQYVAYSDGRIHEVALDFYAQADDGSVWYFGEDVFNYEDGVVADTDGTWLAGREGPPAMIMPANPQVGDVYRPENAPGIVFEETTVIAINETVDGPQGPVEGAIVVRELHMDGATEDKIFAPGYGEFYTGAGGDEEALALAVPTDALADDVPTELDILFTGAIDIFDSADSASWDDASASFGEMLDAWEMYQQGPVPPRLDAQMSDALDAVSESVDVEDSAEARQAALDTAQATLDIQLRYRPTTEIDLARMGLWARQILVDAYEGEAGSVTGDVTTLVWILDRVAHSLDGDALDSIAMHLDELQAAVEAEDIDAAADAAEQLLDVVTGLSEVAAD